LQIDERGDVTQIERVDIAGGIQLTIQILNHGFPLFLIRHLHDPQHQKQRHHCQGKIGKGDLPGTTMGTVLFARPSTTDNDSFLSWCH
jgi:hypothetical protein